jgi:hypothetical protein
MMERPTLAELRLRVHKDRYREIGNWLARRVGRPSAVYGTWLAVRLGLSAHQVTLAALLVNITAAIAIGSGTRSGFVGGVLLAYLGFWLDHVDGQVARWRGTVSLDGVYFDYLMHHAAGLTLGFALGYGLAARSGDPLWAVAGCAIATGWAGLSLHNDCRYKAFFQRLKRETRSYRVEGGSGSRPMAPAPWPQKGIGMFTWPAYKGCEPHVVLIALAGLAAMAVFAPATWPIAWRFGAGVMAVMAPLLALGRASRAITKCAAEREFERWFQPCEAESATELDLLARSHASGVESEL